MNYGLYFSEQLNTLFETVKKPNGEPYSNADVVRSAKGAVSKAYIGQLRRGQATNPGYRVMIILCHFFGTSADYFFPPSSTSHKLTTDCSCANMNTSKQRNPPSS